MIHKALYKKLSNTLIEQSVWYKESLYCWGVFCFDMYFSCMAIVCTSLGSCNLSVLGSNLWTFEQLDTVTVMSFPPYRIDIVMKDKVIRGEWVCHVSCDHTT